MRNRRSSAPTRGRWTRAVTRPARRSRSTISGSGLDPEPSAAKRARVERGKHHPFAFAALLTGSSALALGPWLVRLAGVGPVAAGFWRLFLALPFLFVIARVA